MSVEKIKHLISRTLKMRTVGGYLLATCLLIGGMVSILGTEKTATAAPSAQLNFQARLLTASGAPVPDGFYNIQFKLYTAATGGVAIWTEDWIDTNGVTAGNDRRVRVTDGYLSVALATYTAFPSADWGSQHFITMNVGGTTQTATPTYDGEMLNPSSERMQLTAVPYAFAAANVGSGDTNAASTDTNDVTISTGDALGATSNSGDILIDSGSATGTAGVINLGSTNASAITIGRSGITTTLQGNISIPGAIQGTNALIFDGSTDDTNEITLAITDPGADFTITVPAETGTICTTAAAGVCSTAGSGFVQLAPASAQTDSTANAAININKSGNANLATLDNSNASANGVSIDIQSASASQYALRVTSNNGATTGLAVLGTGQVGIGTATPDARLELAGGATQSAWGLNGVQLQATSATYTDSSTAASGTATNAAVNSFGTPTLAASNSSVTTTYAANVYIQGAPTAGSNMTITNAYALWVDSGNSRFDDSVGIGGNTSSIDANLHINTGSDTSQNFFEIQGATDDLFRVFSDGSTNTILKSLVDNIQFAGPGWIPDADWPDAKITIEPNSGAQKALVIDAYSGQSVDLFQVRDAVGPGNLFVIDSNGDVGIGQGSPTRPLHISKAAPNIADGSGLFIDSSLTSATNSQSGIRSQPSVSPGSASTQFYSAGNFTLLSNSSNITGASMAGVFGGSYYNGTGSVVMSYGAYLQNYNASTGTLTQNMGLSVANPDNSGGGTITDNYAILIADQTAGTNDYGIAIAGADTQALWISSGANNTDAANGIGFGSSRDTNLYRSAADTLMTDDSLTVGTGLTVNGNTTLGNATSDTVTFTGRVASAINPSVTDTYDLGSSSLIWNDVYTDRLCFDGNTDCVTSTAALNGSGWTDDGTVVRLTTATDNVTIGTATDLSAQLAVDGNADKVQLLVQANATQTTDLVVIENSAGTDLFVVTNTGDVTATGNLSIQGNTTLGNASGDTLTFNASTLAIPNNLNIDSNTLYIDSTNNFVNIGSTTSDTSRFKVDTSYNSATAGEQRAVKIETEYAVADTGIKQGLRVNTNTSNTTGAVADLAGGLFLNQNNGNGGSTSNSYGLWVRNDVGAGHTVDTAYGMNVFNSSNSGTLTTQYGIRVSNLTSGVNDFGIAVVGADTQVLWLNSGSDATTANAGIAFGSSRDTNLYRSAANTLMTDDSLTVGTDLTINGNTTLGNAAGDTLTLNGTAVTVTNNLNFDSDTLYIDSTNNRIGVGTASPDGKVEIAGNASQSAWGLNGAALQVTAGTYTDSSTAISGTATNAVFTSFAAPTLAATNTSVTTTNAATVYIQNSPSAGTNQTITNAYSLWVDSGSSRFDGSVFMQSNASIDGNTTLGNASGDTITVNAGTATIVNDLAVTLSGGVNGLNFDSDTFSIDATNNRIGIGTAAPSFDLSFGEGANRTVGVEARATNAAGRDLTVSAGAGGAGATGMAGGVLNLQGGSAAGTTGNANGGNILLTGGAGVNSGARGLVVIGTSAVSTTSTDATCGATTSSSCTINVSTVNNTSAVTIGSTGSSIVISMPDPTITTAGRIFYFTATDNSNDFTLRLNAGGTQIDISMRENTTATLVWNGSDWTAAGASSSTDLQAAYNNTLTSAGGAELVLNAAGGAADGLTVRNNATSPIFGGLLEVQTSIGSNLFTVNNNATEYANNGGAESTTFSMWSGAPAGGTVTRYTTAGNNIATGSASVFVDTTSTANTGAENTLTTTLTQNLKYKVSYAVRHTSSTTAFTTLDTIYSSDGTATTQTCASGSTATFNTWTRIDCTFTATAVSASNAIIIRHSNAAEHDFYIDNLSVTVSADVNHAADGSVDSALGTNWTAYDADGGAGTTTPTRDTSNIYDTSGAVAVATAGPAANLGVRNNMSITPSVSTQYLVTFYAKLASGSFTDITVGFLPAGGNSTPVSAQLCTDYNTRALSTASWTKITCIFSTPSSGISDPDVVIYQPTSGARTFYVDAFTVTLNTNNSSNVQIGGGNKGGPTTLFTLDRSFGAPIADNNNAYLGSMYYDMSTGRIQCYEADGWGACGAAPDNYVNLNPEYSGAVLNGTGVGTMTADLCSNDTALSKNSTLCSTGQARNFYKWTSPQASDQIYSIYVTYQLPTTFNGFSSDDTIQLTARTDSTTNASVTYEMFKSTGSAVTQCGTGETTVVTSANTWQTVGINGNEATGCSFTSSSAGNFVIFKINMMAKNNANAYVSTLSFTTTGR